MLSRCRRACSLNFHLSTCNTYRQLDRCRRLYSEQTKEPNSIPLFPSSGSIFGSTSPWDDIFQNNEEPSSTSTHDTLRKAAPEAPTRSPRRQIMTERESKVITGMFDMLFDKSANAKEGDTGAPAAPVGLGGGHIDDLVGLLRRQTRQKRRVMQEWTKSLSNQAMDQKKEEMLSCKTDVELLEWAQREVFDESVRLEQEAKKAIEAANSDTSSTRTRLPMLQSPVYHRVIPYLMRTFRDQYHNPNLAISIFRHAQQLSTISYVFGCGSESYNELISTQWTHMRDLDGVKRSIEDMLINGVELAPRTHRIVESIRRDLSAVEFGEDVSEEAQEKTWSTLAAIEQMVAKKAANGVGIPAEAKTWDQWKMDINNEEDRGDQWSFNDWRALYEFKK